MDHGTYFLPAEAAAIDLSEWSDILPTTCRVIAANLFADIFVADGDGAVHMLEVSLTSIARITASEEEFRRRCVDDEEGWLLRPLVDRCRSAGMKPKATQCYAFTQLPVLQGKYEVENIWLCSWNEWIDFTASIYAQIKDVPDGTKVRLRIV